MLEKENLNGKTKLIDIVSHQSGNSKIIKGKQSKSNSEGKFPAFSATGQDIYCDFFEHEGLAVVISAVGARCGKCFLANGKWTAIANTHILFPDENRINVKFLWYLVNDENFWIRSGTAQPFVAVKKSLEREFIIPSLSEQHRIVAEVERRLSVIDELEAVLTTNLKRADRLRQAILKRAFEGKLVPQDPTDEPARVLLERIRMERERTMEKPKATLQQTNAPQPTGQPKVINPVQGELALGFRA